MLADRREIARGGIRGRPSKDGLVVFVKRSVIVSNIVSLNATESKATVIENSSKKTLIEERKNCGFVVEELLTRNRDVC